MTKDTIRSYLFGAIGSTLGQLREKPSHFCEDSSVQVQLERETRIELATLCLEVNTFDGSVVPTLDAAQRAVFALGFVFAP